MTLLAAIAACVLLALCGWRPYVLCLSNESLAFYNKGVIAHRRGNLEQGISLYGAALHVDWDFPEAHQNLGVVLQALNRLEESLEHHKLSVEFSRSRDFKANAIANTITIEMALFGSSNSSMVAAWIRRLEETAGNCSTVSVHYLLARLYTQYGNTEGALRKSLEVVALDPTHTPSWIEAGNYYFRARQFAKSTEYYFQALAVANSTDTFNLLAIFSNLAQGFRERALFRDALYWALRATKVAPPRMKEFVLGTVLAIKGLGCHWQDLEYLEELLLQGIILHRQMLQSKPSLLDQELLHQADRLDAYTGLLLRDSTAEIDVFVSSLHCPPRAPPRPITSTVNARGQLRVGFLSYDFRLHAMGYLTSYLVSRRYHDVQVVCLSYGYNDRSDVRMFLETGCQTFIDLTMALRDDDVNRFIAQNLSLHVLVDLTGHTYNNRIGITSPRPAGLLVNYLGFPGMTGCDHYSATFVDRFISPPDYMIASLRERLVLLPYTYQANNLPVDTHLPARIPSERIRVCVLNAHKKFEPVSVGVWASILHRSPKADLFLVRLANASREALEEEFRFRGLNPTSRVHYLASRSWRLHIQRLGICDLSLDSLTYGAHTTAADLMWMGIPHLALRGYGRGSGGRMPSRVASSILQNAADRWPGQTPHARTEWSSLMVFSTVKEFEDTACRLIADLAALATLRQKLFSATCHASAFDKEVQARAVYLAAQALHDLSVQLPAQSFHLFLPPMQQSSRPCESAVRAVLRTNMSHVTIDSAARLLDMWPHRQPITVHKLQRAYLRLSVQGRHVFRRDPETQAAVTFLESLLQSHQQWSPAEPGVEDAQMTGMEPVDSSNLTIRLLSPQLPPVSALIDALYVDLDRALTCFYLAQEQLLKLAQESADRERKLSRLVARALYPRWTGPAALHGQALHEVLLSAREDSWAPIIPHIEAILSAVPANATASTAVSAVPDLCALPTLRIGYREPLFRMMWSHGMAALQQRDHLVGLRCLFRAMLWLPIDHMQLLSSGLMAATALAAQPRSGSREEAARLAAGAEAAFHVMSVAVTRATELERQDFRQARLARGLSPLPSMDEQVEILAEASLRVGDDPSSSQDAGTKRMRRLSIAIYCAEYNQSWWPGWGPARFRAQLSPEGNGGMGGSEEAAALLAHYLSAMGHEVTIFTEMPVEDSHQTTSLRVSSGVQSHVRWMHCYSLSPASSLRFDVFIAWRYALSTALAPPGTLLTLLWMHDLVSSPNLPPVGHLGHYNQHILVQGESHAQAVVNQIAHTLEERQVARRYVHIVPNGVHDYSSTSAPSLDGKEKDPDMATRHDHFIYASAPGRGLLPLLDLWPDIRQELPEAQLHVYYGLTPAAVRSLAGRPPFHSYSLNTTLPQDEAIRRLLDQPGVTYHGCATYAALSQGYRRAGFFLYPSLFTETGCIACLKAMVHGSIPITSRLRGSALETLGGRYDLGPGVYNEFSALDVRTASNAMRPWMEKQYLPCLLRTVRLPEEQLEEHRRQMVAFAAPAFSWEVSARMALATILDHLPASEE